MAVVRQFGDAPHVAEAVVVRFTEVMQHGTGGALGQGQFLHAEALQPGGVKQA